METKVVSGDITQQKVGAIVVNLFEGVTAPEGATGAVDRSLDGAISRLIEEGEIKGKRGEMTLLHTLGKMVPSRVVVAGLGKASDFSIDSVRSISAESCRYIRRLGVESVATIAHGAGIVGFDARAVGQAIAEGSTLGLYRFDKYKSGSENKNSIQEFTIVESDDGKVKELDAGVADGQIIADAVNFCRDMANEPANTMTPTRMAEMALEAARESGLELEVLDRPQMTELGMGALLGVAQGSDEPPKFIILRYKGDPTDESNNLGILGKGITFDSGGLDIKSASGMSTMKGDMAGGAAVISAMQAIGKLKPKINITAIVPATENMPGGRAQRPGAVVRAMNGKTIEVINTDAEGRLVLADALCYAREQGLNRLVDVATLTGAMVTTLGKACTGMMGNNQELLDQVTAAGRETGEKYWQLPMFDEYKELIKSDVADMKNSGGRQAGSISAAFLLAEFVGDTPWVHLDIAGTSTAERTKGYQVKGATGVPARTLARLASNLAESGG